MSFYRRTLPKLLLAIVALTVGVFISQGGASAGPGPFDADTPVALSSTALSANADTTFSFSIEGGDYNYSYVVNNTPSAAFVAPGPGNPGFVAGTHPALGDVMGTLASTSTLGLTNNPCNNTVTPGFVFLNATTDITDTIDPVPQASTNVGSGTTLDNQWSDNGASTTGPGADAPWNAAWPGLTAGEQANGLPAQVDDYPSYLNIIFDPDYPATPGTNAVQPLARYAGAVNVVGSSVTLNLVIFAPDALSNAFPANHPFKDLAGVGYTSIAVLNNPAAPASVSSITDFCTSLSTTTIVNGMSKVNPCNGVTSAPCNSQTGISNPSTGGAPNKARYSNPSVAGTYLWTSFHQSLRDADGDGKENGLDTCPITSDTLNARTGAGPDADSDGIADACDTNGDGATDSDTDAWLNTGDNCPQIANGTPQIPNEQTDSELDTAYGTTAPRGGPRGDSMGDACDADDVISNGQFQTTLTVDASCIGGTDADGDGWCATTSPSSLNDPSDASSGQTPEDYDRFIPMSLAHSGSGATPPMRQPVQVCNDGIDNDGDTLIDLADNAAGSSTCRPKNMQAHPGAGPCGLTGCSADTDGDGFTNEEEVMIGTDALGRCGVGAVPVTSTDWPLDFASAGASLDAIRLDDLTSFLAPTRYLDKSPPNALYNPRYDLVPGPSVATSPWVQLNDLTALIAGVTGLPPMTGGVKAFNGAACTAHPTYGD